MKETTYSELFFQLKKLPAYFGFFLLVFLGICSVSVQAAPLEELLALAKKVHAASIKESYYGEIQYFRMGRPSRNMDFVHLAQGNYTHEMIRGHYQGQVELIRKDESVSFYATRSTGEAKKVQLLNQGSLQALTEAQIKNIAQHYELQRIKKPVLVAGRQTELIIFRPVYQDRYEYRVWIDKQTGILMGASRRNEKNEVVESFYFTRFVTGKNTQKQLSDFYRVSSRYWENSKEEQLKQVPIFSYWHFEYLPAGFMEVESLRRRISEYFDADQWVFSDGINTVSIFFKPSAKPFKKEVFSEIRGATTVVIRQLPGYEVVIIGEVPVSTAIKIAENIKGQ